MISTFYTYRALAAEWDRLLRGGIIREAYSQVKRELILSIEDGDRLRALVFHPGSPDRYLFLRDEPRRKGSNVADVLDPVVGRRIEAVRVAERDRVVTLEFTDKSLLQLVLYGGAANAVALGAGGGVAATFPGSSTRTRHAPAVRSANGASETGDLSDRWPRDGSTVRALVRSIPLFDEMLALEAIVRVGGLPDAAHACTADDLTTLLSVCRDVEGELDDPHACIYDTEEGPLFSLVSLASHAEASAERFDTVDDAVREYWIRVLRRSALEAIVGPFRQRVESEVRRSARAIGTMEADLAAASRADRYERFGHLLMTLTGGSERGLEEVRVEDSFGDGSAVTIPLDRESTVRENAERYYDRARRSRASRRHATGRLEDYRSRLGDLKKALAEVGEISRVRDARRFVTDHAQLVPTGARNNRGAEPGHRFELAGGSVVLVGRNAKENDRITFQIARKHDLWMHARGYKGSHVVLRATSKTTRPAKQLVEAAASIAAYYSKGRGSDLVPVIVTERKYVRKLKGGAPGQVIVEREEVLLVSPRLPRSS